MNKLLISLLLFFILSCKSQNCEQLPQTYLSYSEALSKITNASFEVSDSVNTSSSSWIKKAKFYSCDSAKGFLVLETSKDAYIFKDVPIQVWNKFKKANSFGSFYNQKIKGKYQLVI